MVYLINFLLVPLYYILIKSVFRNKQKANIFFFLVAGIHAILFRALANPYVYTDTEGYAIAFEDISYMSFNDAIFSINRWSEWGQGYVAFNWFISRFTKDTMWFFIVLSVISVGGVMWFYYKNTVVPLPTVLLYLLYPMMYFMGFGVVRQNLSIVFILWALYYSESVKKSLPFALLGILFHTSSVIFLPFYFIRHLSVKKINSTKMAVLSIIGFVIASSCAFYVVSYFTRYENMLMEQGSQRNIVPVVFIGSMIVMFMFTGIFRKIKDSKDSMIALFMIYGFIISLFGMTVPAAGRLTLCFVYCIPVALSLLYKYGKSKYDAINNVYTLSLFVLTIVIILMGGTDNYRVYKYIWEI